VVIATTTPDNKTGIIVCVSCETDFVSKNDDFVAFVKGIADAPSAKILKASKS
jgi:elongation factor Ts